MSPPLRVVIVGGGVASVETVLALRDLAGDRVSVTLIAPEAAFSLRAMSVTVPFGGGPVGEVPLAAFMEEHGGAHVRSTVETVDTARHVVRCRDGRSTSYDALVLTPGASSSAALPADVTFDPRAPGAVATVSEAVELGWARTVAFVVPDGATWQLPIYELALQVAATVPDRSDVSLHVITPEATPLAVFGAQASEHVADRLAAARITFHGGVVTRLAGYHELEIGETMPLRVDKIVALPVLTGRAPVGVPVNDAGFIPVDELGRVPGPTDVWAAGDATDQPIKQGGIACQCADAIAAQIAVAAGADVPVAAPELVLRGLLLTGSDDEYLHRTVGQDDSESGPVPTWLLSGKVVSQYLTPYLVAKDVVVQH